MKQAAYSPKIQKAFSDHLETTKVHVDRLDRVIELFAQKPQAKKYYPINGISKEGKSIFEETKAGAAIQDVGLILAGQKVEHCEISTYLGLTRLARNLGHDDVA